MVKISELTATTTVNADDELPIVQAGVTRKITRANLVQGLQSTVGGVSSNFSNAVYDTQNRLISYTVSGVNYSVTYNTFTTIITGGGLTRTITYNVNGLLESDITT